MGGFWKLCLGKDKGRGECALRVSRALLQLDNAAYHSRIVVLFRCGSRHIEAEQGRYRPGSSRGRSVLVVTEPDRPLLSPGSTTP
jgi:hypothetical protein